MPGEFTSAATLGRDRKNIPIAVSFAGKSNPASIRREDRIGVGLDMLRQRRGAATFIGGKPNVASINKCQLFAIGAKGGHACADNRLRRGGAQLRHSEVETCQETS